MLAAGELRDKLIARGATPVGNTSEQFRVLIDRDRAKYARIIAEKNIAKRSRRAGTMALGGLRGGPPARPDQACR